jgi:hypothetical protein
VEVEVEVILLLVLLVEEILLGKLLGLVSSVYN